MRFSLLCDAYDRIGSTSKRLEKTQTVADLLKIVPREELEPVMLLIQGRVYPSWDKTTLGISQKLAIKALVTATGTSETRIMREFKQLGDLGAVAEKVCEKKRQATLFREDLTIADILQTLRKLSTIEGAQSVDRKTKLVAQLLGNATAREAQYIIRIVLEDLRIGIAEGTIRDGIVWWQLQANGTTYDEEKNTWSDPELVKEWQQAVQDAIDRSNDVGSVAAVAVDKGISGLQAVQLQIGIPTKVMLAQRSTDIDDALKRVGTPAAVEYKYDGFRMQIHKGKEITLFTRRLENVTEQFPDVVKVIEQAIDQPCILDAEVVGIDPATGRHRPFQEISQRIRRKYDIDKIAQELPVEVNVFDLLLLGDRTIYPLPFNERRALLEQTIPKEPGKIQPSEQRVTQEKAEIEEFYAQALANGYEGLMFKTLDGTYQPGSRVGTWVKLKPTLDTLDLVVIGAEWGEGKRSGWLTSFTLACLEEDGIPAEIGKVGTGFKELEQEDGLTFQTMTDLLKEDIIAEHGKEVTVKPKVVLEIKCEEIQRSPSYGSGFALRFPRVVRIRSDRRMEEISTIADVLDLFEAQKGKR